MEKHINVIGALWIVYGAINLIIAFIVFSVLFGISFIPDMGVEAPIILRAIATFIFILITIFAVPDIIGGIWLMKRKEWARILILALSFFNLIVFPFGTALSVYSFVILFREDTTQLFRPNRE
jgi:hypothetical protein